MFEKTEKYIKINRKVKVELLKDFSFIEFREQILVLFTPDNN